MSMSMSGKAGGFSGRVFSLFFYGGGGLGPTGVHGDDVRCIYIYIYKCIDRNAK